MLYQRPQGIVVYSRCSGSFDAPDSGSLGSCCIKRLQRIVVYSRFSGSFDALDSGSLGSCCIKGRNESLSIVDAVVPLMHLIQDHLDRVV